MLVKIAQNWFKCFQSGNLDIRDEPRSSRLVMDKVDAILKRLKQDRHIDSYDIAEELGIENKTACVDVKRIFHLCRLVIGNIDVQERFKFNIGLESKRRGGPVSGSSAPARALATSSVQYSNARGREKERYTKIESRREKEFLLQSLEDLDSSLRKLNSRLFVVRGQPTDALPKLFREWGTTALTFEEDPEPYGRVRDHNIMTKCREVGITVSSRVSHTLYQLDKIIELNGGKAPLTYHQFQALVASMPPPPPAEPAICRQTLHGAVTPLGDDHDDRFGVPTLEELGFETEGLKPPMWIGGENEALIRLERHLERKAWVASFGRPKMTPQSLLASQTGLSPYLRFGCLSTRLFYYQLTELYKRVKRVRPPLSLHGQLLWREFFYCAATRNPNFDRMEGNPICVQIPWEKNQDALAKWANGQTGYPWIDAIMIQLREEGWIHQLARHAVACFLTRGDLWISWEEGMKVFDELMLDADWSVNAGTWMWLSCSSFFQQFFHCYCPVRFGRKADPQGDFISMDFEVAVQLVILLIDPPFDTKQGVLLPPLGWDISISINFFIRIQLCGLKERITLDVAFLESSATLVSCQLDLLAL
ncbi:Cryptochrome-1 [Eumeta japonica]|uniref:Cryptochrome-1 n=1 Tax=Eumeta variegata TaxID=151549 RepID=A0A4C1ZJT3_EUMVA|nr:Cryptochrome-1 [Eumeta japonica]